jgi:Catalase
MTPPQEALEPNEAANIAEMIDILRRKMSRDYDKGQTLRDAHPKAVGLLRGRFRIEPDLPKALQVGLFAKARTFDCWLRLSNASGKPQSDAVPDARGFAIKLMSARGKGAAEASFGQDFVLLSTPVMPLGTVAKFRDAVHYTIESSALLLGAKFLLTGNAGVLLGLAGLRIRPSSHLDIRYWSTTPYRFGAGEAVKYSLIPTSAHRSTLPALRGASYLRDALQSHLSRHEASFDFCVQLRKDGMPIEDAAVEWKEKKSPFIKVATLTIPKQKFRTHERDALAETLSFSPGHALPAHAPLGGLNRARIKVYTALSKFRHQRDHRPDLA